MITLLYNGTCSKSNCALEFLEEKKITFQVRNYLENPLNEQEIELLLAQLQLSVHQIIRKNEPVWTEKFSCSNYSEQDLIAILANYPILMQRPILIINNSAIIAREIVAIEALLG